jgi:uroporphyrinogen-III synthase
VRILIVRPAPGNAATAAAVSGMGLEPVVVPLFEIRPLEWDAPSPDEFDAVAMTSANAARHGGAGLARFAQLPVFAVGEATAEAARMAGFREIQVATGNASDLGTLLKPLPFRGGVGVGAHRKHGAWRIARENNSKPIPQLAELSTSNRAACG